MLKLGEYYDEEKANLEFKEFYLKINPNFLLSSKEIFTIINSGIWNINLNRIIDINLRNYIRFYLPKYISCYMNSNINGNLIFGINDCGEISGIPYQGELNISSLEAYIKKVLRSYTKGMEDFNKVSFEVIKLEIDTNILDDNINKQLLDMDQNIAEHKRINEEYKEKKIKWLKEMNKYSTKFYNIMNLNDSRQKLIQFCKDNNANQDIIDLLESDTEIPVILNKAFYKRFKDKNDVVYWAGEFKDRNIERLSEIKPSKGEMPKLTSHCLILRKISDMRLRFLKNNSNINYYIISIRINGKQNNNIVYFRLDASSEDWITKFRVDTPIGPGCI